MKTLVTRIGSVLVLTVLTAVPAAAQDMKAALMDDFERMRGNVLGMVDEMPETGLRTAPTDGVRDFAQQIEHVVDGNVSIIGSGVDRPASGLGDPEKYLNSKDALKAYVNRGFDAVGEMLGGMTDADFDADTSLFGAATVKKWKLAQTAYEHGVWTLGATVPYLRLNGGVPPGYNLIPGN